MIKLEVMEGVSRGYQADLGQDVRKFRKLGKNLSLTKYQKSNNNSWF